MKKFLDCISIVGATPSKFHGTKKYISTGAVATTEIDESEVVEVTYEDRPSRANLSAEAGDILFAKMQGTRKTLLLDSETEKNIYSTGFYAVRANPEVITTECLYYLIDSELFLAQKDKNCSGATQKAITNGGMAKIEISVPPLSEQGILVDKLKHLTQLITDKKKQLNLFDEIIKSRFIEMFGNLESNPKGWKQSTLGDECYYIKDGPHKSPKYLDSIDGIPFISTRNVVSGDGIDWSTAKYISEADYLDCIKKCHPEKGDILYSKGGTTGIAKLVDTDIRFANWVHVAVLKFGAQLDGRFLECMLNMNYCYAQSQALTKGIANKDFVLSAIAQVKIYVPPIELQRKYTEFVKRTDKSKYHGEFTCEMEVAA